MKKFLSLIALMSWLAPSPAAPTFTEPPKPAPPALLFRTDWAPMPRPKTGNKTNIVTETEIISRRADFDLKARTAIYSGAVRVKDPRMDLACEALIVKMSRTGGKFESVIAEKNVSIEFLDDKGQRIHGTGGRAVYTYNATKDVVSVTGCVTNIYKGVTNVTGCVTTLITPGYTNDVIELFEDPVLETIQGVWKGDVITIDRANNNIRATNSRMVIRPDASSTNSTTPLLAPIIQP